MVGLLLANLFINGLLTDGRFQRAPPPGYGIETFESMAAGASDATFVAWIAVGHDRCGAGVLTEIDTRWGPLISWLVGHLTSSLYHNWWAP